MPQIGNQYLLNLKIVNLPLKIIKIFILIDSILNHQKVTNIK
jgi:hypothetical protein